MLTDRFHLRITGRPTAYQFTVELAGTADSIAHLRDLLRPFVADFNLTTAEVQSDLRHGGMYEVRSPRALSQAGEQR